MIAGPLLGDVPALGPLVQHQVVTPLGRAGDVDLVAVLLDAVERVEGVQNLGGVADDEQDLGHGSSLEAGLCVGEGSISHRRELASKQSRPAPHVRGRPVCLRHLLFLVCLATLPSLAGSLVCLASFAGYFSGFHRCSVERMFSMKSSISVRNWSALRSRFA